MAHGWMDGGMEKEVFDVMDILGKVGAWVKGRVQVHEPCPLHRRCVQYGGTYHTRITVASYAATSAQLDYSARRNPQLGMEPRYGTEHKALYMHTEEHREWFDSAYDAALEMAILGGTHLECFDAALAVLTM